LIALLGSAALRSWQKILGVEFAGGASTARKTPAALICA